METKNVTVFGTIDDHDMGMNNGDSTFLFKTESGMAFLDFVGEDKENVMYRRAKNGHGVYGVKVFDFDHSETNILLSDEDAGIDPDVVGYEIKKQKQYKDRRVAIFMLDVRTHKTPWGKGLNSWQRNYDGDFLGEKQWLWFETALGNSDASVNIIVNGLQIHPFRHPNANLAEQWAQFPASRQRLYDIILRDGIRAPVLVSGDVHMAQLMRKDCWARHEEASKLSPLRPLIEFTTSGMTHSWNTVFASSQKYHKTFRYYPMHILGKTVMTIAHWIVPMPDLLVSNEVEYKPTRKLPNLFENGGAEGSKQGKQFSLEKNFGEIEIDWENRTVGIRAFGADSSAAPLLSSKFSIDQLSGLESLPSKIDNIRKYKNSGKGMIDGDIVKNSQMICMNHRGPSSHVHFILSITIVFCVACGPQLFLAIFVSRRLSRRKK